MSLFLPSSLFPKKDQEKELKTEKLVEEDGNELEEDLSGRNIAKSSDDMHHWNG
jgi:hypothetical protein